MNVGQLKKALENVPDNMDVFIEQMDYDDGVSIVESAVITECNFTDGKLRAKDDVFLITDY